MKSTPTPPENLLKSLNAQQKQEENYNERRERWEGGEKIKAAATHKQKERWREN